MYRSAIEEQVGAAETALRLAVAGLGPDEVPAREAVRVFEGLEQIVRTATAARTMLARATSSARSPASAPSPSPSPSPGASSATPS